MAHDVRLAVGIITVASKFFFTMRFIDLMKIPEQGPAVTHFCVKSAQGKYDD